MSTSEGTTKNKDLALAAEIMAEALSILEKHPEGFPLEAVQVPDLEPTSSGKEALFPGMQTFLAHPKSKNWLKAMSEKWPKSFASTFTEAGSVVGQILQMFGLNGIDSLFGSLTGSPDLETFEMLMTATQMSKESKEEEGSADSPGEKNGPDELVNALLSEVRRRNVARGLPLARTVVTLLGHDALLWLSSKSQSGMCKLQPHEFSRTGWGRLWQIETQLEIEQELRSVPPDAQHLAKMVVALSWTLVALAGLVPEQVFIGEADAHLSSVRDGQYTLSYGDTRTLVTFSSAQMPPLLHVLQAGLMNDLLTASDMMWIGLSLIEVKNIKNPHEAAKPKENDWFDVFLSHRGCDSKRELATAVQRLESGHGVFLDCLVLPHGVINSCFVFGSLASSSDVLIVESENFNDSDWCRKEAWFAGMLEKYCSRKVVRVSLSGACDRLSIHEAGLHRRRAFEEQRYTIRPRVLQDIDYWARKPNLHSLKEAGHPTRSLDDLISFVDPEPEPDNHEWTASLGKVVLETLRKVVAESPGGEPLDLWSTALQYSVAALGSTTCTRSKVDVRRGIDHLNEAVQSLLTRGLHHDRAFKEHGPRYLAVIAVASVVQMSNFTFDGRFHDAAQFAMGQVATIKDGLVLLDARQSSVHRTFNMRLIASLMQTNIGSVGIVQNASDEVHKLEVDGFSLEVIPCVTLYPGMTDPFSSRANGVGRATS